MRKTTIVKHHAQVTDTVRVIKFVARNSIYNNSITVLLKKYPFKPTLTWFKQVASFVNDNLSFINDATGREQIKTPDRLFSDRGGDCDDYSTMWSALLTRLNVKHHIKIIKYDANEGWAHVFVIVPVKNGSVITLDSVYIRERGGMEKFNKQIAHVQSQTF